MGAMTQQTQQTTNYTFDASLMDAIAKDYADEYARQQRMDVQDMMVDIRRVNRAMYWDGQFMVPLASVTDVLPDSLQGHAAKVNDWLVLARNYTTALRRALTDSQTTETRLPVVLSNMFPVLNSAVNMNREVRHVLDRLEGDDTTRDKSAASVVQELARDGGLAGLDMHMVGVLDNVVSLLGGTVFGANKSLMEVEWLMAPNKRNTDTGYPTLTLPDYVDLGVVYNDLMHFVLAAAHRSDYPGAWDGCDSETMHKIVYRWISRARYVEGHGEDFVYLYLVAALAKRRPHIYTLVLEVSRWLEDNYARVRPQDALHRLSKSDFLLPEAEDMAALLVCPGFMYENQLIIGIKNKVSLSEPNRCYMLRLATSMPEAVVKDDGTVMVEHYARPRDMVKGRRTTTTPGRFVKKILDNAGDNIVKSLAEHIIASYKPLEVEFISDLDPDGWSDAYMNARGFTSCMTPEYGGDAIYSAVRAYAARSFAPESMRRRMTEVALAVLRSPDTGQVVARSIVNKDTERYVRVYGDDRLGPALKKLGYKHDKRALVGCHLYLEPTDLGECHPAGAKAFYCPYLDGHLGFTLDLDDTTTWDLSASELGILVTMIAPDDAIDLIKSDYDYVYRGNTTTGTISTRYPAEAYEFEE